VTRITRLLVLTWLLLIPAAATQADTTSGPIVKMAPYNVKAGPLGYVGIRCSLDVAVVGLVSGNARIRSMVVSEVFKGSAAEKAGIRVHDQVLSIDGMPITELTVSALKEYGRTKEKGDAISLGIRTPGSSERPLTFQLGPKPTPGK
jgi:C-terminal processing protease CtpA/Prc